jgi:hypothetical protein
MQLFTREGEPVEVTGATAASRTQPNITTTGVLVIHAVVLAKVLPCSDVVEMRCAAEAF